MRDVDHPGPRRITVRRERRAEPVEDRNDVDRGGSFSGGRAGTVEGTEREPAPIVPSANIATMHVWRPLVVALVLSAPLCAQTEEKIETWDTGGLKAQYGVDAKGRRSGLCKEYFRDGILAVESHYKDGLLDGPFTSYLPNGKRGIVTTYLNGKIEGNLNETRADGARVSATYRGGLLEGGYQSWHPNGGHFITASFVLGQLSGAYEEVSADGSRVWTATWIGGALDGASKLAVDKKTVMTQKWRSGVIELLNGFVPHPRPAAEVRRRIESILSAPLPESLPTDDPAAPRRHAALRRLQAYRYLCGVPWEDVTLDPVMTDLCNAAAEVCEKLDRLDHTPPDPGGLPPGRYEQGRRGAGNSNLYVGGDMADSVDGYMDDSDESNITALGHRRWCINPSLRKTGFGCSHAWSAMWSMDRSGSVPKGLKEVCYPPPGFVPTDFFGASRAWSISFVAGRWAAKVRPSATIQPLDAHYLPAGPPLTMRRAWVASGGYGVSNCVAFLPADLVVMPGRRYLATVSLDDDATIARQYVVEFVEPVSAEKRR